MRYRATVLLIASALLSTACSPRLAVENDTANSVEIDVIARSLPRDPFLRELQSGMAFDAKMCGYDALHLYFREKGGALQTIDPGRYCSKTECGCSILLSRL